MEGKPFPPADFVESVIAMSRSPEYNADTGLLEGAYGGPGPMGTQLDVPSVILLFTGPERTREDPSHSGGDPSSSSPSAGCMRSPPSRTRERARAPHHRMLCPHAPTIVNRFPIAITLNCSLHAPPSPVNPHAHTARTNTVPADETLMACLQDVIRR